jgi:queuine/archaeosine tRNA-ribosyltransferase
MAKCFIKLCNNPAHEYSRYCLEHLQRRGKSARQLQWETENIEGIKEDLEKMKEKFKQEWSTEEEVEG